MHVPSTSSTTTDDSTSAPTDPATNGSSSSSADGLLPEASTAITIPPLPPPPTDEGVLESYFNGTDASRTISCWRLLLLHSLARQQHSCAVRSFNVPLGGDGHELSLPVIHVDCTDYVEGAGGGGQEGGAYPTLTHFVLSSFLWHLFEDSDLQHPAALEELLLAFMAPPPWTPTTDTSGGLHDGGVISSLPPSFLGSARNGCSCLNFSAEAFKTSTANKGSRNIMTTLEIPTLSITGRY
eukprot:GHVS01050187.1.p2 GENE.GHVS01050187.1~~GHVS01050187.1.p2  ORF type:complete len:239 (+),score=52.89 GHVS01050187.1:1729-2445(+)